MTAALQVGSTAQLTVSSTVVANSRVTGAMVESISLSTRPPTDTRPLSAAPVPAGATAIPRTHRACGQRCRDHGEQHSSRNDHR
jgi:hypothetical protein